MILFDWKKVLKHSERSPLRIIQIIRYITFKPIPLDKHDIYLPYTEIDWRGQSFLVNPELLLYNAYKHSRLEVANYIGMASLRNFPEYQTTNKLSLDLLAYTGKEDIINQNSLLTVRDGEIHFLYEVAN